MHAPNGLTCTCAGLRGDSPHNEQITAERRDVWRETDDGFLLAKREIIVDQSVLGMSNLAVFL